MVWAPDLANDTRRPRWAQTAEELHSAIHTRNIIGQAQGIIMERYPVSSDQAFSVLSRVSLESNVTLHEIAAQVVTRREIPGMG